MYIEPLLDFNVWLLVKSVCWLLVRDFYSGDGERDLVSSRRISDGGGPRAACAAHRVSPARRGLGIVEVRSNPERWWCG